MTDDWKERLTQRLEPVLAERDPRPQLSSYHDMPYAIFRYDPRAEFAIRKEITLLTTRLEQKGKRVTRISLAECLWEAIEEEGPLDRLVQAEKSAGLDAAIETVHGFLAEYQPLVELVAKRFPPDPDPFRDIIFIIRVGSLYPVYRPYPLVEQMKGRVDAPAVLFYPGELAPPAGLRFMGIADAEHNYRPKIF
jgi:hypothetical protein